MSTETRYNQLGQPTLAERSGCAQRGAIFSTDPIPGNWRERKIDWEFYRTGRPSDPSTHKSANELAQLKRQ